MPCALPALRERAADSTRRFVPSRDMPDTQPRGHPGNASATPQALQPPAPAPTRASSNLFSETRDRRRRSSARSPHRLYSVSAASLPSARQSVVTAMTDESGESELRVRTSQSPESGVRSPDSGVRSPSWSPKLAESSNRSVPTPLRKLHRRIPGARQIIGNESQHSTSS